MLLYITIAYYHGFRIIASFVKFVKNEAWNLTHYMDGSTLREVISTRYQDILNRQRALRRICRLEGSSGEQHRIKWCRLRTRDPNVLRISVVWGYFFKKYCVYVHVLILLNVASRGIKTRETVLLIYTIIFTWKFSTIIKNMVSKTYLSLINLKFPQGQVHLQQE
jgi:hypothetical protein